MINDKHDKKFFQSGAKNEANLVKVEYLEKSQSL